MGGSREERGGKGKEGKKREGREKGGKGKGGTCSKVFGGIDAPAQSRSAQPSSHG